MQRRSRMWKAMVWTVALCGGVTLPSIGQAQRSTVIEEEAVSAERAREAELAREREAARARAAERERDIERAKRTDYPADRRHYHNRPGELYVGGFGGYTFGHSFSNIEGTSPVPGTNLGNEIDLKNSAIYGVKIGYFLPNRWNWLGLEVEGFNTTPHFKQTGVLGLQGQGGAHLRVATVAFNAIIRGKMMCDHRRDRDREARRTSTDPAVREAAYRDDYRDRDYGFCRLQPYVGAGLGLFFAETSNGSTSSDNLVPGFNGLAGVRYFFTEHVALFGEYKYNRATFNFDSVGRAGALSGDYSVSHVVGGLSFHF